jgi:hypothetical protein
MAWGRVLIAFTSGRAGARIIDRVLWLMWEWHPFVSVLLPWFRLG